MILIHQLDYQTARDNRNLGGNPELFVPIDVIFFLFVFIVLHN